MAERVETFEDLEVFQRAYRISLEVHRTSLTFPSIEQHALGDQVRRASKSICANIAEGFAKQGASAAEFKRYLGMSIGSSDEMRGRDESLGAVLPGPGLYRRGNVAPLAGRVPGNLEDVAGFVPKMAQALKPGVF